MNKLEHARGFPEQETVIALEDELDYQKATQAFMWGMPEMVIAGQHNSAKLYDATENTDFFNIYKDPALLGIQIGFKRIQVNTGLSI